MTGTRTGGLKAAQKNLKNNPNFYRDIGRLGGKVSSTGGFAANPELARLAGAKGGRNSRRGPALRDKKGRAITKSGEFYAKKKKVVEEPAPQEGFLYRLFRRNK